MAPLPYFSARAAYSYTLSVMLEIIVYLFLPQDIFLSDLYHTQRKLLNLFFIKIKVPQNNEKEAADQLGSNKLDFVVSALWTHK